MVCVIYLPGRKLIGNLAAAEEDEPEKRLACWWLNCSGIPARYGRCLRYAYIIRYSGFANPVRDPGCLGYLLRGIEISICRWNLKAVVFVVV